MAAQSMTNSTAHLRTLIIVVLDESGSMAIQKSNVIGGYNNFIMEQRELKADKARLLLLKFSTRVQRAQAPLDLALVPMLTAATYNPNGLTALYDAVRDSIYLGDCVKLLEERILVLIMTDGEENNSRTTSFEIRKLISTREVEGNWTFTYIGVAPERWAALMRQDITNTIQYDMANQGQNFMQAAQAAATIRQQPHSQQLQGMFNQPILPMSYFQQPPPYSLLPMTTTAPCYNSSRSRGTSSSSTVLVVTAAIPPVSIKKNSGGKTSPVLQ